MKIDCARCGFKDPVYDLTVKRCPSCGGSLAVQQEAREDRAKDDDALKRAIGRIR